MAGLSACNPAFCIKQMHVGLAHIYRHGCAGRSVETCCTTGHQFISSHVEGDQCFRAQRLGENDIGIDRDGPVHRRQSNVFRPDSEAHALYAKRLAGQTRWKVERARSQTDPVP